MLTPLPAFARPAYDQFSQTGSVPGLTHRVNLSPAEAREARDNITSTWDLYRGLDEGDRDQFAGQPGEVKLPAYGIHGARIGHSYSSFNPTQMVTLSADPIMADGSFSHARIIRNATNGLELLTIGNGEGHAPRTQLVHVDALGQSGYILMEPPRGQTLDPKFFASAEKQARAPKAFALQPAALAFHQAHDSSADRVALAGALQADPVLAESLRTFDRLTPEQQLPVLQQVFAIECQTLGITPPELIMTEDAPAAFFEFNLEKPDAGKVFINPRKNEGFESLALLVHETRHSLQFQQAFGLLEGADPAVAEGWRAAFQAQRELSSQLSFVDFCSLLNEYEAFQFGNSVVGAVTGGKADSVGMGTLASQYDEQGNLQVDLRQLFAEVGPEGVLDHFNQLSKGQYDQLYGKPVRKCC